MARMKTELGSHLQPCTNCWFGVCNVCTGFIICTGQPHNLHGCPRESKMSCTQESPTWGPRSGCACRQSVSPTRRPRSALGQCGNQHRGQFLESVFEAGRKKLWIGKQIIIIKMREHLQLLSVAILCQ